ncbi:MAG: hypothetical protein ACREM2_08695, partial [Vulcanimicrobiaceae bacterium]
MHEPAELPLLSLVRALTAGGPFAAGDRISIAFDARSPLVGRVVGHRESTALDAPASLAGPVVPETISVEIEHPAGPFERGEVVTLSFIDPRVARMHRGASALASGSQPPPTEAPPRRARTDTGDPAPDIPTAAVAPANDGAPAATAEPADP